jgi:hypothetical protein
MVDAISTAPVAGRWQPDDRVRRNTTGRVNRRLDQAMLERVRFYAGQPRDVLDARLRELEEEWDIERWLELSASALTLGGTTAAALRGRRWLALTGLVAGFLLQHAVQGWCPPLALFRRVGVRTRQEIDTEVFALKALRGDFGHVPPGSADAGERARAALDAAGRSV